MQFIVEGQRIATENFVPGRLYTILFKTETQVNLTCISTGAGCVTFKGEAPINLFTLSMRNAETIDTIEPTQLGTNNYNNLINKPAINGVDLIGNKTSAALGIREVPTAGESDNNKVLTAASDGSYSWQVIPEGTTDYTDLSNKPQIAGVTLTGNIPLTDLGAAAASDIPTTPGDIGAEPAITSDNKLDPALIDYDSTHAAITSAQVEQIGTNQNNILKLLPTSYTVPRLSQTYNVTLVWGGYCKVGNVCIVNMRLNVGTNITHGDFFVRDLPTPANSTDLTAGQQFCPVTNSRKQSISIAIDSQATTPGFGAAIANTETTADTTTGLLTLFGMYLTE